MQFQLIILDIENIEQRFIQYSIAYEWIRNGLAIAIRMDLIDNEKPIACNALQCVVLRSELLIIRRYRRTWAACVLAVWHSLFPLTCFCRLFTLRSERRLFLLSAAAWRTFYTQTFVRHIRTSITSTHIHTRAYFATFGVFYFYSIITDKCRGKKPQTIKGTANKTVRSYRLKEIHLFAGNYYRKTYFIGNWYLVLHLYQFVENSIYIKCAVYSMHAVLGTVLIRNV